MSTSPEEYEYPNTATFVPFGAGQKERGESSCAAPDAAQRMHAAHTSNTLNIFIDFLAQNFRQTYIEPLCAEPVNHHHSDTNQLLCRTSN